MGCCSATAVPLPEHFLPCEEKTKPHKRRAHSVEELKFNTASFVFRIQERLTTNYRVVKKIGEGTYGNVWKVVHRPTGQLRAVKTLPKAAMLREQEEQILREVAILKDLDHPNILKIFEVVEDTASFHIVTELCTGGDLLDRLSNNSVLSESQIATYMYQILSAVAYCHDRRIVHRDIKPENVLLMSENPEAQVKIIDFGTSYRYSPSLYLHEVIGTLYYLAPEVLDEDYTEKCDIWSCGVLMYLLLGGKPPFDGRSREGIAMEIRGAKVEFLGEEWTLASEDAKRFICRMLTKDQEKRPSARELLADPWILATMQPVQENSVLQASILSNLRSFRSSCKLHLAALQLIAWQFAPIEATEPLKRIFVSLDADHDGKLSRSDLESSFHRLFPAYLDDIESIIAVLDCDQNGYIEFNEFLTAALDWKKILTQDVLRNAFRAFGGDGKGMIGSEELKRMLIGEQDVDATVWSDIIREADSDGDGLVTSPQINLREFTSMVLCIVSTHE